MINTFQNLGILRVATLGCEISPRCGFCHSHPMTVGAECAFQRSIQFSWARDYVREERRSARSSSAVRSSCQRPAKRSVQEGSAGDVALRAVSHVGRRSSDTDRRLIRLSFVSESASLIRFQYISVLSVRLTLGVFIASLQSVGM